MTARYGRFNYSGAHIKLEDNQVIIQAPCGERFLELEGEVCITFACEVLGCGLSTIRVRFVENEPPAIVDSSEEELLSSFLKRLKISPAGLRINCFSG